MLVECCNCIYNFLRLHRNSSAINYSHKYCFCLESILHVDTSYLPTVHSIEYFLVNTTKKICFNFLCRQARAWEQKKETKRSSSFSPSTHLNLYLFFMATYEVSNTREHSFIEINLKYYILCYVD